jgi:hypothetical protein
MDVSHGLMTGMKIPHGLMTGMKIPARKTATILGPITYIANYKACSHQMV